MNSQPEKPEFEEGGGISLVQPALAPLEAGKAAGEPKQVLEEKPTNRGGIFKALRHKNFRLFWSGAFISNIGNWMQTVGQNWLVLSLTHSPFLLGLVNFIGNAPLLILGLFGGVVADRKSRKTVLLITQTSMGLLIMSMALLTFFNVISVWIVLIIALGIGCVQAFNGPAYQTIMLDLVGPDDLMNAIALNSVQFNLTRIIGPSIAGALVVVVGVAACFFINSLSFLAVIGALLLVRLPPVPSRVGKASVFTEIKESLGYLRRNPPLAILISLCGAVSLLLFPYITLLSVFAKDVFHSDATDYGILLACVGVGAAIGAVFVASQSESKQRSSLLIWGASVVCFALIVFSLSNTLYLSMAILPFVGGSMVIMMATMNTIVQTTVPSEMRGRIIGIYTLASTGLLPFGNLVAGTIAQTWGAPVAVAGGGVVYAFLFLGAFLLFPKLKEY